MRADSSGRAADRYDTYAYHLAAPRNRCPAVAARTGRARPGGRGHGSSPFQQALCCGRHEPLPRLGREGRARAVGVRGGGREWTALPGHVGPVTTGEPGQGPEPAGRSAQAAALPVLNAADRYGRSSRTGPWCEIDA
ncbi:hypothetical protein ACFV4M_21600 [Kitasatospora indigofera]|uniref:hypothetical protein n=1 Tax=Kitasatospora indigofera TaxID=67307 RepID=UPI00364FFD1D